MSDDVIAKSGVSNGELQSSIPQPDAFSGSQIETIAELLSEEEKGEDTTLNDSLDDTGEFLRPEVD